MTVRTITKEQARRFLIAYQGLTEKDPMGKTGILAYVQRVGCIQYDPLNVVGRNADLVLQSRIEDYKASQLEALLYTDRTLVDGWDKMMAIHPTDQWPHYRRVRERHADSSKGVMTYRGTEEAMNYIEEVRQIIHTEGPKFSRDIQVGEALRGTWGSGKFSNVALDYLFHAGILGVRDKKNAHKNFDLIENLLPQDLLEAADPFETDEAFYRWYTLRRINSVGLLWEKNGGAWLGHFLYKKDIRHQALKALLSEKRVEKVHVEGIKEPFYIDVTQVPLLEASKDTLTNSARFIAPLDNLLWDRSLIEKLFGFTYTWEVYVPLVKRQYGYYVLPVLYGDRFVARFEAEKQRGTDPLVIKNWWWEEDVAVTDDMEKAIRLELEAFCRYLGCGRYELCGAFNRS